MKRNGFVAAWSRGWKKFRSYPVLFNLAIIVLLLGAIVAVSYFAMSIGTRHHARRTVPDFVGITTAEAERVAAENDLQIIVNDSLYVPAYVGGAVLDQLPKGGVVVKPGRKIYVTVNSFRQRMVDVPYVAGYSLRQAKNMLEMAGLGIERIEYVHDLATNYVLAQFVGDRKVLENSNIKIEKGSGVVLQVGLSSHARPIFAPSVLGRSLVEAKSRLWELGLNIGDVTYDPGIAAVDRSRAKVCWQSVAPGRYISYGGRVSLQLTLDNAKVETALKGVDVKALEERMMADSIAHAAHQRLVDSLAEAETAMMHEEAQKAFEADSLAHVSQDSLNVAQKPDSLSSTEPTTTPQE